MTILRRTIFFLLLFLLLQTVGLAQQCDNWLRLTSFPSAVNIGDLDITGNKITVEALFTRTTTYSGGQIWAGDLVSKHNTAVDNNYLLRPNNAELTTDNGFFSTPEICEIELNKTYHAALVYDGAILKFYRDGYLMSSVPATGNLSQNNFQTKIGLYDALINNTQMIGYVNEIRIWNVVRTQAEIRAYMTSSLPNPTTQTGLLAYYTFDNLLNKQGNPAWNGTFSGNGTATINQVNPYCRLDLDSCGATIINDYTPATSFDKVCKNIINVADASRFKTGDTVLIMQMQGADITTTNTSSFGSISDYKSSGNYEFNYIKQKIGNQIELLNVVTRTYDVLNGKVQLIRVPYFETYTVASTLTCLPWDGSKGGVLAFNVKNDLVLKANIDVSGKGFKGGLGTNTGLLVTNCFTNEFFYPVSSTVAANKGQSIALMDDNISRGKGTYAGGGGGGLDHNSGGGGGGNGGVGGFGGYQLEPCGNAPFDNRGIGGRSLNYTVADNKIFMGSGGGAGHANNPANISMPASGGNGGGIIIISARSLTSNSNRIISNGTEALGCTGLDCHDGMGGGGAGGTILMNIPVINDNSRVEIKGGKGANMTGPAPTSGRLGPGGGGGGGVLWMANAVIPSNIVVNSAGGGQGVIPTDGNSS